MLFKQSLLAALFASTGLAHWKQVLADLDVESLRPQIMAAKAGLHFHNKRQDAAINETFIQIAPQPYGTVSLPARYWNNLGAKREIVKYGPFTVPPMNEGNGMADYLQIGVSLPCTNCVLTYMHAGLELPDGTNANAYNNQWLHHVIIIDFDSPDTVCGNLYYAVGQRFFASGNERTVVDLTKGKIPTGYYIQPFGLQVMLAELMNAGMQASQVVVTIEYEYIEGGMPANWFKTRPIWLDIAGCDIPSDMPPKTNTTFSYTMSPQYTSAYSGIVLGQGGHVHDGGVNLHSYYNGKVVCTMTATYATKGAYVSPKNYMMSGPGPAPAGSLTWKMPKNMPGMSLMMREHVTSINFCRAPQVMEYIQPGDKLWNDANYNFNTHAPMLNWDTSISDIMGITVVYMAEDMTVAQFNSYRNG